MDNARAEILRFWRSVELFSPQPVPSAGRAERVYDLDDRSAAPWEAGHHLRREPMSAGARWRHTVYCGVFARQAAFDVLRSLLPADPENFDDRPTSGDGALVAFLVSDAGRPLPGSEVLSGCAWALGRAVNPGPGADGWLHGLGDAQRAFTRMFRELADAPDDDWRPEDCADGEPGAGPPIRVEALLECTERVVALLGLHSVLAASGVRVKSRSVRLANAERVDDHDFLNSFIAEDLGIVAEEVAAGNYGRALHRYLTPEHQVDVDARLDVEQRLDVVNASVAPGQVPLGRWPAKADHPLGLSQQLAVASAMASLADRPGLFTVNGPPGTGKTTMLREVVADVVVRRAQQLAALANPLEAFEGKHTWKTGDYLRTVHTFKRELTGFEMVVACATNAAAENITIEIPGIDAIDPDRRAEIDYFPGLATRLLRAQQTDQASADTPAWAMVAGCLGSRQNCRRFAGALWFTHGPHSPKQHRLEHEPIVAGSAETDEYLRLQDILVAYGKEAVPPWEESVAAFQVALEQARGLAEDRARVFALLERARATEQEAELCRQRSAAGPAELVELHRRLTEQLEIVAACRGDNARRAQVRHDHRKSRPKSLLPVGRAMREWRAHHRELTEAARISKAKVAAAEALVEQLQDEERAVHERAAAAALAAQRAKRARAELAQAAERFGRFVPDERWWQDRERRELQAPWIDAEWNAARTELFLAALRLHKAFVMAASRRMLESLRGAIDILTGSAPADLPEAAALAAWQSLFFMVPVLSTTFASFARVFSHLGREALGWLFVDEAAQSSAQAPAGAIWRARRVVIVGDPLQLDPVVTLPFTAQQAIRREHDVAETWLPSRCSAQSLADRVSVMGTVRGSGDDAIWVGVPLNVHRRCDEPMFSIVNEIAYHGQMVNATPLRSGLKLPPSKWLDVVSTHSEGHWIPAEGEKVGIVLDHLDAQGQDFAEVFVLTPFRQVAHHRDLISYCRRYPGITIGTVHVAQGREADIVIVVLGGDPNRPGAKRWAAAKPNLLNVAVSRSKRRLYVIGDRESWAQHAYFDVLARRLPVP